VSRSEVKCIILAFGWCGAVGWLALLEEYLLRDAFACQGPARAAAAAVTRGKMQERKAVVGGWGPKEAEG